jgi:hypothetical protein
MVSRESPEVQKFGVSGKSGDNMPVELASFLLTSFLIRLNAFNIYREAKQILNNESRPCFMHYFFNASGQYTPHLNLSPFNFGLMPFGLLRSISLNTTYLHYYLEEHNFLFTSP